MEKREVLGHLKSGETVVDRYRSHLHAGVRDLLSEAFAQITSGDRDFIVETVDFGRVIGETICVATGPDDVIVYAQRVGRAGPTRFVKHREPEPCSRLMVVLKLRDDEPGWVCLSAFIGGGSEREPWDPHPTERSVPYWSSHALLWGHGEEVIEGTETSVCPWWSDGIPSRWEMGMERIRAAWERRLVRWPVTLLASVAVTVLVLSVIIGEITAAALWGGTAAGLAFGAHQIISGELWRRGPRR